MFIIATYAGWNGQSLGIYIPYGPVFVRPCRVNKLLSAFTGRQRQSNSTTLVLNTSRRFHESTRRVHDVKLDVELLHFHRAGIEDKYLVQLRIDNHKAHLGLYSRCQGPRIRYVGEQSPRSASPGSARHFDSENWRATKYYILQVLHQRLGGLYPLSHFGRV